MQNECVAERRGHMGSFTMSPNAVNQAWAETLAAELPSMGYLRARVLPDGTVAALLELIFTRAICLGVHEDSWTRRFCFEDRALADRQFDALLTEDDTPDGHVATRQGRARDRFTHR